MTSSATAVHPHVCGENESVPQFHYRQHRFIPTCVGKTYQIGTYAPDFLRFIPTCVGKTQSRLLITCSASGSSPRVWGKRRKKRLEVVRDRFIPTCVGKTSALTWTTNEVTGSSPRVWGKRSAPARSTPNSPVHPHVCGENDGISRHPGQLDRFIPTCVGKTRSRLRARSLRRFIPTCVGKTGMKMVQAQ